MITFRHFEAFWCTTRKERKYKKKLLVLVDLPCLGYNNDKLNILMHIYWCLQRSL